MTLPALPGSGDPSEEIDCPPAVPASPGPVAGPSWRDSSTAWRRRRRLAFAPGHPAARHHRLSGTAACRASTSRLWALLCLRDEHGGEITAEFVLADVHQRN